MEKRVSDSAKRLRELMDIFKISQTEFCKRTNLAKSTVSLYVNGKRIPQQQVLSLIAETFAVDPAWLMGLDVPMKRPTVSISDTPDLLLKMKDDKSLMLLGTAIDKMNEKQRSHLLRYAEYLLHEGKED